MANTAQARKRIRQAEKNRLQNTSMRSAMRTACKKVVKALAGGEKAQAETDGKTKQSDLHLAKQGLDTLLGKLKADEEQQKIKAALKNFGQR